MIQRIRTAAKTAAPFVFTAAMFLRATPEGQESLLRIYALATAAFVGWYIIAKFNYLRWEAAAPQREAASRARTRALLAEMYADKPERQTADYFNWDGPDTVAGQPR